MACYPRKDSTSSARVESMGAFRQLPRLLLALPLLMWCENGPMRSEQGHAFVGRTFGKKGASLQSHSRARNTGGHQRHQSLVGLSSPRRTSWIRTVCQGVSLCVFIASFSFDWSTFDTALTLPHCRHTELSLTNGLRQMLAKQASGANQTNSNKIRGSTTEPGVIASHPPM